MRSSLATTLMILFLVFIPTFSQHARAFDPMACQSTGSCQNLPSVVVFFCSGTVNYITKKISGPAWLQKRCEKEFANPKHRSWCETLKDALKEHLPTSERKTLSKDIFAQHAAVFSRGLYLIQHQTGFQNFFETI